MKNRKNLFKGTQINSFLLCNPILISMQIKVRAEFKSYPFSICKVQKPTVHKVQGRTLHKIE